MGNHLTHLIPGWHKSQWTCLRAENSSSHHRTQCLTMTCQFCMIHWDLNPKCGGKWLPCHLKHGPLHFKVLSFLEVSRQHRCSDGVFTKISYITISLSSSLE